MNQISGFNFLRQGKVRDVYAVDNNRHLLIIVSDRISAFDADAEISNVSYGLWRRKFSVLDHQPSKA